MARYTAPTGKNYKMTDAIYGMLDAEDVNAHPENYVLMARTVHAKVDGILVASEDRRFIPKAEQKEKEAKGWKVVSLSMAEKADMIPLEKPKK